MADALAGATDKFFPLETDIKCPECGFQHRDVKVFEGTHRIACVGHYFEITAKRGENTMVKKVDAAILERIDPTNAVPKWGFSGADFECPYGCGQRHSVGPSSLTPWGVMCTNCLKKFEVMPGKKGDPVVLMTLPGVPTSAVDHPAHYGGEDNPYEVIKVIEAWGLTFNTGNAVKYIGRAGKKNELKHIEDLEKAAWYLKREIDTLKAARPHEHE